MTLKKLRTPIEAIVTQNYTHLEVNNLRSAADANIICITSTFRSIIYHHNPKVNTSH